MKTQNYVFFDFECSQEKMIQCKRGYQADADSPLCQHCKKKTCGSLKHEPNPICIAHRVCTGCRESPVTPSFTCKICGKHEHIFSGKSARDDFCTCLFSGENDCCIVLAHNFNGYDSLPIRKYLHQNRTVSEIISQGLKKLSITIDKYKIKLIDSLSFLNTRLANLPKMFGLQELKKGYYPHLWNTKDNDKMVLDILPDIKYCNCESIKDDERCTFKNWYEEHINNRFDFKEQLIAYCSLGTAIMQANAQKIQHCIHWLYDV